MKPIRPQAKRHAGKRPVGRGLPGRSWFDRPRRVEPHTDAELLAATRVRARVAAWGLCLALVLLCVRAGWVMGVPDERLEERGREQFRASVEVRGRRGSLYDRNGRVLAATTNLPSLYANPAKLTDAEVEARVAAIVALTGKSESWVRSRFAVRADGKKAREVKLGDALAPAEAKAIVHGLGRDQMWLVEEPVRVYPGRDLAAPLLGFTDVFDEGAAGLEKVLEKELAGETVRLLQEHDRKGRAIDGGHDDSDVANAGHSVMLTLDASIQFATERALDGAMAASQPLAAMAVVMDVKTGAILAIGSRPSGNPNDSAARAQADLFKNRPAMDQIEPGSVFKPFVAAAAIEEGLVTPETMIDCELGRMAIGPAVIKDDHPKGVISVHEIIKFSSNIGAAKLAMQYLGAEKTLAYLKAFGFGRSTGLGLPGEWRGTMRKADNIKPIELATTAFGQGVTASPIQLVSAVAALANGGVRMHPRLVEAILDRNGQVELPREPREDARVISEETAHAMALMMESVTEEGGTGTRARVAGYRVAGKTGTAQKVANGVYSAERISSFVGFLPADRPEIAIAVAVDSPTVGSKYGGIVAAPVFAEIGAFSMRYLGIAPDPAEARPDPLVAEATPVEVRADGQGRWILPDLSGRTLRAAVTAIEPAGLEIAVEGSGRLVAQSPPAGTPVLPGDAVVLSFN